MKSSVYETINEMTILWVLSFIAIFVCYAALDDLVFNKPFRLKELARVSSIGAFIISLIIIFSK